MKYKMGYCTKYALKISSKVQAARAKFNLEELDESKFESR